MFTLVTGIVGRWRAVCVTALQRPNSDATAIDIVVGIAAASLSVKCSLITSTKFKTKSYEENCAKKTTVKLLFKPTLGATHEIIYLELSSLLLIPYNYFLSGVVCDESCTQEKEPGPEGGEVVLRVHQTGIRLINWILLPKGDVIVTVKPGQSYDDKDVLPQYRGRVSSLFNGSLQISNLSPQDQRIYKADMRTNDDKTFCELFNLTVYERLSETDIKINHSLIGNDSCSLSLLCTVDKRDVTVTWSQVHRGPINVIQGVLYVLPSDVNVTYICTARNRSVTSPRL
ncbi:unnamed protein product [Ranitomeya imitator]|uniref:Immunoglobulin V-set domain-containing protein n=1 Tax=Ranitomeya imitator TaxID=111125 RepID=A0ABN9KVP4_9NEOB|nr:unnamed protein product [Ranitomeya imitator]